MVREPLVLACYPGIKYPLLEESSSLEKVVACSVADVKVVGVELARSAPFVAVAVLECPVPASCAVNEEECKVEGHGFWVEVRYAG